MIANTADDASFRQALLTSPGERQEVEYKSAIPFDSDNEFGLKLIKHILGMANIGGGWIVIGCDDDTLQPDSNHSLEIAATYDTTRLSAAVDRSIQGDQPIRLSVFMEIHPRTRLPHPIIQVQGFERTPFICRSTKSASDTNQLILQTNKVYIRRPGAATSEIQAPSEWEELLGRWASQRRVEFISEFNDMFGRMNEEKATLHEDAKERLSRWVANNRNSLAAEKPKQVGVGYIESGQILVRPQGSRRTIQELRKAAVSAGLPGTDWIGNGQLFPTESGIEGRTVPTAHSRKEYWHLEENGAYFSSGSFREDFEPPLFWSSSGHPEKMLWFDLAIFRIARALLLGAVIFEELNISPDEPYLISIKHEGLEGRTIYTSVPTYPCYIDFRGTSRVDTHEWRDEVTRGQIRGQLTELVNEIANSLFAQFAFAAVTKSLTDQVISKYEDLPQFTR